MGQVQGKDSQLSLQLGTSWYWAWTGHNLSLAAYVRDASISKTLNKKYFTASIAGGLAKDYIQILLLHTLHSSWINIFRKALEKRLNTAAPPVAPGLSSELSLSLMVVERRREHQALSANKGSQSTT